MPRVLALFATALLVYAHHAGAQAPTPSADNLALARQLVAATSGNKDQTLAAMNGPMIGLLHQMGITDPAKAQAVVTEAMLPTIDAHFDELLTIQARNYAQVLSGDDLRAIIAFYDTQAGQDLIKAQPALASARLTGLTQWLQSFQPELVAKVKQVSQAHGWPTQP